MQKDEIIYNVKKHLPTLKQNFAIDSLAFFGSFTRNDFTADSDVDIIVDFKSDNFLLFVQLADELERITQTKVDLVTKRSIKERHWNYLKDKLIYV
jgi:predicted nucleotidyltransferase